MFCLLATGKENQNKQPPAKTAYIVTFDGT
jgi:hypothetical protein